ncbi:MAG: alpha-N-arabinofuranosidase [Anaerolineae bacterium]|nr:alpha-N-arabinofuranosidase [Anaerolineae bacterium]
MNTIYINPNRTIGTVDRNIFGGFAEHMARCVYEGMYDPESPLADEYGLRQDVIDALRRLRMPLIRYPGGNFASGYRWRDGIGPLAERPPRLDLAWQAVDTNQFGADEFVRFCRRVDTEPFLVVNCGDGDMREARDWVEYCNGSRDTALTRLRRRNGSEAPHRVKYWGIGNEVDGHWQIGYKTPAEYARAFTEFGKVMKWVDPSIKLIASCVSDWNGEIVERGQLLLEQAGDLVDYLDLHWYVNNQDDDFAAFMANTEIFEPRLDAFEGLIRAVTLQRKIERPAYIAVGEWNVCYRTDLEKGVEEVYNLEDALMVGLHLNAFLRRADTVKMANIAQIVNMIAPIRTQPDGLVLQTIFYPFEVYSQHCGDHALDIYWQGDTFQGGRFSGVRVLDVAATLDSGRRALAVFVVNRERERHQEARIVLEDGIFAATGRAFIINGRDIKVENTFDEPHNVVTRAETCTTSGKSATLTLEPHSVTALLCEIQ